MSDLLPILSHVPPAMSLDKMKFGQLIDVTFGCGEQKCSKNSVDFDALRDLLLAMVQHLGEY